MHGRDEVKRWAADYTAFCNPMRILDALDLDDVWIDGTAMEIEGDPSCPIDVLIVKHPDGHATSHRLPMRAPPDLVRPPIVKRLCARCRTELQGETVDQLDAAVEAHAERCLVVGDRVRWNRVERDMWLEGRLIEMSNDRGHCLIDIDRGGGNWQVKAPEGRTRCDGPKYSSVSLRRIERPGQARQCCPGAIQGFACGCSAVAAPPPSPTLYDGMTAEQCLEGMLHLQREDRWEGTNMHGETRLLRYPHLTDPQLAAASAHWSAQLRARQQAARERERTQVVIEQDGEDLEW